ncbi:MepB family protein [Corynebacterium alimapuense]|uniref:Metallopeptidase n=1 Tax=Corynebacterium alimapuense TaxID=1576874 RepID=A0A3M8KB97_9CORY|nr:MepB family protein [Corynebacterium alimapuense]RNE49802.1 metallopeptidase [Corynebacterium alimapuense]
MDFLSFHRYLDLVSLPKNALETITPEAQSSDYESGNALIEGSLWRIRTARATPTKPGAFVAVWQRMEDGTTAPFEASDPTVGLFVFVTESDHFGVFRFTTEQLISLRVLATQHSPGKRGFRVYPPWCTNLNPQAARSQDRQSLAFFDLTKR